MQSSSQHASLPPGAADYLWNADLAPTTEEQRTWSWVNIAALWVGMVICVPSYLLASGLIAQGMNWWQAILTVFLGNFIVMVPMLLIGHAGAKYGIPFPVLLRASFGTLGARLPGLLRGLVACGWFGIQTWVGGSAIYQILNGLSDSMFVGSPLPFLDIDVAQLICFLLFWGVQVFFIMRGMESIRWLETLAAPLLLAICLAMLYWAYDSADGFDAMFAKQSAFVPGGSREGEFWRVFLPGITAMVGFWSTLTLNIPDFTRFARSQRHQMIGQAIGLPLPMALLAFISVAVTMATVAVFGEEIWDPVALAGRLGGASALVGLGMLIIATLTTNLAANVVAPANGFCNLAPHKISFRMGGLITAGLGIAMMPWKLLDSAGSYLFVWLVGYSSLLGPIAGILIIDYFLIRKCELELEDLYRREKSYEFSGGWNPAALIALAVGIAPNIPGFLHAAGALETVPVLFDRIYDNAWFVGALVSSACYYVLMAKTMQHSTGDTHVQS
ncbi:MAG: NCS1 family nucleobase:cation symporter-1 [Halieaceae bacterium]|jgi:NCS1 family nucleobase:cation symporter-1